MTNTYYLYKHIFPNNKLYIGITQQIPEKRWLNGYGYKNNKLMWRAINKFGWKNIKHEIIFSGLSEIEANKLEQDFIKQFNTTDSKYGYNIRAGGLVVSGWHHSEETRKKLSITSSKPKTKPSAKRGRHCGRTTIYQYSLEGDLINTFTGYWEAGQILRIPRDSISDCANGHSKTCYGFTFSKQLLTKEAVLQKIKALPTRCTITIYQYDNNYTLLNIFNGYKQAVQTTKIKEATIESVIEGRSKTANNYVFSKKLLTNNEIAKHYLKNVKKINYKIIKRSKIDGKSTVYYSMNDLAIDLNVTVVTAYKILNGKSKLFSDKYLFIKESLNENKTI